jgi:predicted N-acetyltransferase YhbS
VVSVETAAYVLLDPDGTIAGYYTLSNTSVGRKDLSNTGRRGLYYPITAGTLIGRLAIRKELQGDKASGRDLIWRALKRCAVLSAQSGSAVVVVDTIDDRARKYYAKAQFKPFPQGTGPPPPPPPSDEPEPEFSVEPWWLKMQDIRKALVMLGQA